MLQTRSLLTFPAVDSAALERNKRLLARAAFLKNKKEAPACFFDFGLTDGVEFPLLALRAPMKKTFASLPLCLRARSASKGSYSYSW